MSQTFEYLNVPSTKKNAHTRTRSLFILPEWLKMGVEPLDLSSEVIEADVLVVHA